MPMLAVAGFVWVALLLAAPVLAAPLGAALYGIGAAICHQLPERSFHLAGSQLPVCARCIGIYLGAAAGLTWGRTWPRARVAAAAIPTAATVLLEAVGIWHPSNVTRMFAGVPLGAAAAALLISAVATLHYERCTPSGPGRSSPPPPTPI